MKKEIKDYLHLYLGCEIEVSGQKEILDTVGQGGEFESLFRGHLRNYYDVSINPKLILRSLTDMTEDEFYEFKGFADKDGSKWVLLANVKSMVTNIFHQFDATAFLLSKHFDVFGLIDAGLAIDATKIKK